MQEIFEMIDAFENSEEEKRYVLVHLNDGRLIQGYPKYFSTNQDEERIYLIKKY